MALFAGGTMSATVADDPTISDSGRGFLVPKGGLLHFDFFVKFSKEDRFLLLSQSFRLAWRVTTATTAISAGTDAAVSVLTLDSHGKKQQQSTWWGAWWEMGRTLVSKKIMTTINSHLGMTMMGSSSSWKTSSFRLREKNWNFGNVCRATFVWAETLRCERARTLDLAIFGFEPKLGKTAQNNQSSGKHRFWRF